ncbi:MAG: DnaD domain protein [Clostridia bacterium]|nr:DnaD domain protein [Clostridia bacterium]
MALCSYSSKLAMDGYTVIDNTFLNEFLPQATGDDVKVYLYGLNLCTNPNTDDNSLDTMSKILSLTEDDILKSFSYWQEMGLVQIVSTNPLEIRFLPVRARSGSSKIRNKDKYTDFNTQIQAVISGRMITPTEYNEYYSLIETYHFEPEALVMIAKYCTTKKSTSIGYPYILAVARNYADEGLKTIEAVEQKFIEYEQNSDEIKRVLTALGLKREADIEERNLYLKWNNNFGFINGVIVEVAKSLKKKGGFAKLDSLLSKYYEQKLFTMKEISAFSEKEEEMYELAKIVSKNLGLYYQNFENVVDVYIADWTNKGYDAATLTMISMYCFKQSIRTLDAMNTVVQKFFKLGLVSLESIEQYISGIIKFDEEIKVILDRVGLVRSVSSFDRDFFKTWTNNWGFSNEQILQVAEISKGKSNPMSYLNKILSSINERGLKTDKEIADYLKSASVGTQKVDKPEFEQRNYTAEEMNALFDSLEDIEV